MEFLLREFDIYYSEPQSDADPSTVPLEPLENVGGADVKSLLRGVQNCSFVREAALILLSAACISALLIAPVPLDHSRTTAEKWSHHLTDLLGYGVISAAGRLVVRFTSKYFAVLKANGQARTIHNTRALNKYFKKPKPVNLAGIQQILRESSAVAQGRHCYFLNIDLKNYYHQLPLPKAARSWFGIRDKTKFYLYHVLPMGWAWSCFIAQCLSWGLVLGRECGAPDLGVREDIESLSGPPQFIDLWENDKVVGKIFLVYDNIGVIGPRDLVLAWHARIAANARQARVVLKHADIHDLASGDLPTFLGVTLRQHTGVLQWTHSSRKTRWTALQTVFQSAREVFSAREVAKAVGVAMWNATIQFTPLCAVSDEIALLQRAAICASAPGNPGRSIIHRWSWHGVRLTESEKRCLVSAVQNALEDKWYSLDSTPRRITPYASDASLTALGVVDLADGEWRSYEEQHDNSKIFEAELRAAELAIREALLKYAALGPLRIILLIDNTAACHCLRRMHSLSPSGARIIQRIACYLADTRSTLEPIGVRGVDNVADEPSRQADRLDLKKMAASCAVACDYLHGNGKQADPSDSSTPTSSYHHAEPELADLMASVGNDWHHFTETENNAH